MKITVIIFSGTKSNCQIEIEMLKWTWWQTGTYSALEAPCITDTVKRLHFKRHFFKLPK